MKHLECGIFLLGLAAFTPSAHATLLGPGGGCLTTCSSISSLPAGTVIANTGVETGIPAGTIGYSATLQSIVYQETATGDLDFLYQYTVTGITNDAPDQLQVQSFSGWITNAEILTTGGIGGMVAGTGNAPNAISRGASGSSLNFIWLDIFPYSDAPLGVGQTSDILVVETNAKTYGIGQATLQDGGVEAFQAFEPGPEPAGIVLFGTAAALTAFLLRRRSVGSKAKLSNQLVEHRDHDVAL